MEMNNSFEKVILHLDHFKVASTKRCPREEKREKESKRERERKIDCIYH